MSNKGILIFSGVALIAGAASYLYIKKQNEKLANENAPDPKLDIPANKYNPAIVSTDSDAFPLKIGSQGAVVAELQKALGMSANEQDGIFGPITEGALLAATGIKTVASQTALDAISSKGSTISANASRYALAEQLHDQAMADKMSVKGTYVLEPNKDLQVYQTTKIPGLDLYVHTSKRLTNGQYDYMAYTGYPNVRLVSVDKTGFILMYDYGMKKYFYTSPYDWILS